MVDVFLPLQNIFKHEDKGCSYPQSWQETLSDQQERKSFLFHRMRRQPLAGRPKSDSNIKNPGPFLSWCCFLCPPLTSRLTNSLKRTRGVSAKETPQSILHHTAQGLRTTVLPTLSLRPDLLSGKALTHAGSTLQPGDVKNTLEVDQHSNPFDADPQ